MNYENFKEQFIEDVKDRLYEQGSEVNVTLKDSKIDPCQLRCQAGAL